MRGLLRIAFRNLFEHRAKSIIIGILLSLGVVILVLGSAVHNGMANGIERSFTKNYTADIIITGIAEGPVSLFGVASAGGLAKTPTLPEYEKILTYASSMKHVAAVTGMASTFGIAQKEEQTANAENQEQTDDTMEGNPFQIFYLFGVDTLQYRNVFPDFSLREGNFFEPGMRGIILNAKQKEGLEKYLKKSLAIGNELVIQGASSGGVKIVRIPIIGIYEIKAEGYTPDQLAYCDIDTVRILDNMTIGANIEVQLSSEQKAIFETTNYDDLFSDSNTFITTNSNTGSVDYENILGDTSLREELNKVDTGAWHFILIRTDKPDVAPAVIKELNTFFKDNNIAAQAGDWKAAAGEFAQSVDIFGTVLFVGIIILAFVVVVIIMNTLVVSVIERTTEIGTIRALGASRSFVRRLFFTETLLLSLIFGSIGIVLSYIVNTIIRSLNIKAGNRILELLFGGPVLSPIITGGTVATALIIIVLVGIVAHFYPVSVALRIEPIRAIQTD
ncbi:MAG TPA: FtsX-like permease family protein [Spirochaetia bacterium]|nr:FtsX-like permease family protein [Spirochaetales bacterium]HPD80837.1 FtsX-like permease family protein [Spirochaetales bacterium]HQK34904.1 FtsX-like permease family protein [Spirochaetales bacterium]HRS65945.1 FtsX-like permease family protein [Spirochaetia bacterium]HRV29731.1 FtsX-like permease family protein [Spirochaetia bacterium]